MQLDLPDWVTEPFARRSIFAALVTVFGLATYTTPADEVMAWSMFSPTGVLFWLWALSRRFPFWPAWVLGLSTPMAMNIAEVDTQLAMMIAVVTVAAMAAYIDNRTFVRNMVIGYMFVISTLRVVDAIEAGFSWPMWVIALGIGWAAGHVLWRYGHTVDELEQTRSLVVDQGMLQERRRIARDVHDLVGHSLTVVLLHITGARHLVHTDPDEAERALEQAEAAGRQSLAEIRRTVTLLRDDADAGAPAVPSADLSDVKELVDDFVAAGLDVQLDQAGPVDLVDPATALAGFRITQEALTNASRHTLGAQVFVTLRVDDESCEVQVTNQGGETIDLGRGSGFGLISMRERAKSVGGSLVAGPTADGWTVDASLPIDPIGVRR